MKKLVLSVLFCFLTVFAYAERTFSFGQISSYSPQVGMLSGGGIVITVTIGDDYIYSPVGEGFMLRRTITMVAPHICPPAIPACRWLNCKA